MGVLEEVTKLKSQNVPEDQIVYQLQQQGFPPKSINDALSQSQIKSAVSQENELPVPSQNRGENTGGFGPQTQETEDLYAPQDGNQMQEQTQEYAPQTQGYNEGGYDNAYAPTSSGYGADTIVEISEQVFEEKSKEMQKEMDKFNEFRTLMQTQVEDLAGRLKRMESIIDRLQIAILQKVGSYGENLQSIKKEMAMMQSSFGKMVNPLASRSHRKTTTRKATRKKSKK